MTRGRGERIRPERVAEQIRMDVASILHHETKDPRLKRVTCTRVVLTKDLKHAKLYVSVLGDGDEREDSLRALESATGYVRRLLSQRLSLRVSPEITFVFDPSVEYGIRLEKLIDETKKRSPQPEEEEPGSESGA